MALNKVRNAFWRVFSTNAIATVEAQRGVFARDTDTEKLANRYLSAQELSVGAQKVENVVDLMTRTTRDQYEHKELELYKATRSAIHFDEINYAQVIENFDRIQVLKNLEMIEKNEKAYDPEVIEYEKLKAKYLLGEEGAEEKLKEYVKNRPFFRPYYLWSSMEEKHSVKLWPF
mmetsp:Transcript_19910/g.22906  ORF Transcript_19910/g.22906 Transcript_19910/m.22906 type:complete len:174 (-) Transcript_19910:204-725(-)